MKIMKFKKKTVTRGQKYNYTLSQDIRDSHFA